MTVSPTSVAAPLNASVAQPQPPTSLQAVLAGGANLGGTVIESSNYGMPVVPGIDSAAPAAPAPVTGGGDQAAQGAAAIGQEQLIAALQNVISSVAALVAALQAQGGVTGGGAPGGDPGQVGQCGMPGCTMDHGAKDAKAGAAGAKGAPDASAPQHDAWKGAKKHRGKSKKASASQASRGKGAPVLATAMKEAGASDGAKYIKAAGGDSGEAWCGDFVQWVFKQNGLEEPPARSVPALNEWAKSRDKLTKNPKPGDLVMFDWDGDGTPDHVGIFRGRSGGNVRSVDGNTTVGGGKGVAPRERPESQVLGYVSMS